MVFRHITKENQNKNEEHTLVNVGYVFGCRVRFCIRNARECVRVLVLVYFCGCMLECIDLQLHISYMISRKNMVFSEISNQDQEKRKFHQKFLDMKRKLKGNFFFLLYTIFTQKPDSKLISASKIHAQKRCSAKKWVRF